MPFACVTTTKFPSSPFQPENVTFPAAAHFTAVPVGAPMSIPVWVLPHLYPYLDVNTPETGLVNEIPKLTLL